MSPAAPSTPASPREASANMKLFKTLCYISTAALAVAFLFSSSCAAMDIDIPSSSSGNRGGNPSEAGPEALQPLIKELDPERIKKLVTTNEKLKADKNSFDPYTKVPFWKRVPLYNIDSYTTEQIVPVVEQALKDFGVVGLLDETRWAAHKIAFENGQIAVGRFEHELQVIMYFFSLDDKMHQLERHRSEIRPGDLRHRPPKREPTDLLPHLDGKPIIRSYADSPGNVWHAFIKDPQEFWYLPSADRVFLVGKQLPDLFREASVTERQAVIEKLDAARESQAKYGEKLSSLIHGEPVYVQHTLTPRTGSVTTFHDVDATRQKMIGALLGHGKLTYYHPQKGSWEVRLHNWGAGNFPLINLDITPIQALRRARP